MALPRKVKWSRLDPAVRTELNEILAAYKAKRSPLAQRFHAHADEFFAFLLLAFLAALGGAIASAVLLAQAGEQDPYHMNFFQRLRYLPQSPVHMLTSFATDDEARMTLCIIATAVLAFIYFRQRGRRGLAITERALVVLRGPRVRVLPLSDIAGTKQQSMGKSGKRFTVLYVTMKDGSKINLYATKDWANAAEAKVAAAGGATA